MKYRNFLIAGLIIVISLTPIVINVIGNNIVILSKGEYGEWLSFWGSYLGGIVGMVAVVITTFVLIGNQNKQHFELLAEQKKSIDEAAEINDKKTREREHKLFLININEELVQSLIQMTKLIKLRNEVFRKINNFGQEISHLNDQREFFRNNQLVHGKEDMIHETTLTLMMDIKASQFRESELLAEIEIEIAKVRILYAGLDIETNEIENINSLLRENSDNMVEIINRKEFGDNNQQIITKFDQEVTELLNEISSMHVENIKLLFDDYKK